MGKLFKWLVLGFLGLTAIGAVVESTKTPEQQAAEVGARKQEQQRMADEARAHARAEQAALPSYNSSDLAIAYSENTVAADQRFKDKRYKVSGVVESINTDLFGYPYLVLRGGVNEFMEPQFSFDNSAMAQLSALRKGMKVSLICVGTGDVAKTPMSGDCVLL